MNKETKRNRIAYIYRERYVYISLSIYRQTPKLHIYLYISTFICVYGSAINMYQI